MTRREDPSPAAAARAGFAPSAAVRDDDERLTVVLRGGGDLGTGVALCLHRAGMRVIITELDSPLAVRRTVSFAEAIYEGSWTVEGIEARRASSITDATALSDRGIIPVLVAPDIRALGSFDRDVVVDARLTKLPPEGAENSALLVIGLGPGFTAGGNCDAVVETQRGHTLGRVYWTGTALSDTGKPEGDPRRVLRAPRDGVLQVEAAIGDLLEAGELVATVDREPVSSPFAGVLRGLARNGLRIRGGVKIGDVDASGDPSRCFLVSDKALAIGGAVLGAILARSASGRASR